MIDMRLPPLLASRLLSGLLCAVVGLGAFGSCFHEFPWQQTEPDVRIERLCLEAADPDRAPDTTFITCQIEGASFAPAFVPPKREIVVYAYNILRGFQIDAQIALFQGDPRVPRPDVLLLSEVDRGCQRTQFRNVARDYAQALGFYYLYATEFVELPGDRGMGPPYSPPLCEHGNAIVSRYPLGNARAIRHAENSSWYTAPGFPNPDEPRLGGRVALAADMKVGRNLVRLVSVHLESRLSALAIRDAQAREVADDAARALWPAIVGGDFNSFAAIFTAAETGVALDLPILPFLEAGYIDAHHGIGWQERATTFDPIALLIDFVFVRGLSVRQSGVCPIQACGSLSDHLPIWTRVLLPPVPHGPSN